jgi:hypothetical protein
MKVGGRILAILGIAMGLCVPAASAQAAATATLAGDDGQPAPLNASAPPTIRNMQTTVEVQNQAPANGSWKWWVTDQAGSLAVTDYCWSSGTVKNDSRVGYRGNGTYTIHVQNFTARSCASGAQAEETFTYTVSASVAIPQPPALMTRPVGTSVTNTHLLDFAGNVGAQNYEIRFAKGGVLAPDGSISGGGTTAIVDAAGKIRFWNFDGPGQYLMVARAQSGDYFTPWSAPITITMVAPFDLLTSSFPDSRGPSYQLKGTVREKSMAGSRVTVAVAKGKKGKRFKTLGKPKVNSNGDFRQRFRLARGTYRLRFSYKGSSTIARGTIYQVITIRRVIG